MHGTSCETRFRKSILELRGNPRRSGQRARKLFNIKRQEDLMKIISGSSHSTASSLVGKANSHQPHFAPQSKFAIVSHCAVQSEREAVIDKAFPDAVRRSICQRDENGKLRVRWQIGRHTGRLFGNERCQLGKPANIYACGRTQSPDHRTRRCLADDPPPCFSSPSSGLHTPFNIAFIKGHRRKTVSWAPPPGV